MQTVPGHVVKTRCLRFGSNCEIVKSKHTKLNKSPRAELIVRSPFGAKHHVVVQYVACSLNFAQMYFYLGFNFYLQFFFAHIHGGAQPRQFVCM